MVVCRYSHPYDARDCHQQDHGGGGFGAEPTGQHTPVVHPSVDCQCGNSRRCGCRVLADPLLWKGDNTPGADVRRPNGVSSYFLASSCSIGNNHCDHGIHPASGVATRIGARRGGIGTGSPCSAQKAGKARTRSKTKSACARTRQQRCATNHLFRQRRAIFQRTKRERCD